MPSVSDRSSPGSREPQITRLAQTHSFPIKGYENKIRTHNPEVDDSDPGPATQKASTSGAYSFGGVCPGLEIVTCRLQIQIPFRLLIQVVPYR